MEERSDGILLRTSGRVESKLSWEETANEMAAAGEDWTAWDAVAADGLDEVPWNGVPARPVAERSANYRKRKQRGRKR
jgi:hypothetical protein